MAAALVLKNFSAAYVPLLFWGYWQWVNWELSKSGRTGISTSGSVDQLSAIGAAGAGFSC
jgi:hypothetical protein